jgi:hypothetical protein
MFGLAATNPVEELHKRACTTSFKLVFPTGMKSMAVTWAKAQEMALSEDLVKHQPRIMFDPERE